MPLSSVAATPNAPGWRRLRLAARVLAWLAFAAWSLCLLAWLILHWGILPRLDQWRPQIEALATRSLGLPVQIGQIQVRSGGWLPAVIAGGTGIGLSQRMQAFDAR